MPYAAIVSGDSYLVLLIDNGGQIKAAVMFWIIAECV